jgi:hypothetical protein
MTGKGQEILEAIVARWRAGDGSALVELPAVWRTHGTLAHPLVLSMFRDLAPWQADPAAVMPPRLRVYRGQRAGQPDGISWSRSFLYAATYATRERIAAVHVAARGRYEPAVLSATVGRAAVLAWWPDPADGLDELIIDPHLLGPVATVWRGVPTIVSPPARRTLAAWWDALIPFFSPTEDPALLAVGDIQP